LRSKTKPNIFQW